MKRFQSETASSRVLKIVAPTLAFVLWLATPAFSQIRAVDAVPAGALSSAGAPLPSGVKVLAQVPLPGLPVTRMYTQWESGRTYLYIEHGRQQLTTVDVTRKQNPQLVDHAPAKVEPVRYEELAEGGTIEVSAPRQVIPGVDNGGGPRMFSVLESSDPDDAALLQAIALASSNLADRDRHLDFFASPARLLIVEDRRWKGMDYTIN